jgi:hypothetical protein
MKLFKKVNISSNGSLYFAIKVETSASKTNQFSFQKLMIKLCIKSEESPKFY